MSLLFPLYILGAAAIALPILLHRRRQKPDQKTSFSSLMFLEATPPRVKTRSRLENLLLLFLRCLAFLLLALCFARPFMPSRDETQGSGLGRRVVLLVDVSASMRRDGLDVALKERVTNVLQGLAPDGRLAVMTFSNNTRRLVDFEEIEALDANQRLELVVRRLAGVTPGWGGSDLGKALVAAAEEIAEDEAREGMAVPPGGRVRLLSDMQNGSVLEDLNTFSWPTGVEVVLDPLEASEASNAGLHLAAFNPSSAALGEGRIRVRVRNSGDSSVEQFSLCWLGGGDGEDTSLNVYVPAGKSRVVLAPEKPVPGASVLRLSGDAHDFDNRLFIAPQLARRVNILYLSSDSEEGPDGSLFYLRKVFQPNRHLIPRVTAWKPQSFPEDLRAKDVHLAVAESPLSEGNLQPLRHYLAAGRTLLFILNDEADAGALQRLMKDPGEAQPPDHSAVVRNSGDEDYRLIEQLDVRHPVLSAFAEPRFRDFTKVHFWKYRKWKEAAFPSARILARFDNGDPAIAEIPVGAGNVLVLTSGWRPQDSQLAVSTKFVPLLFSILERSAGYLSDEMRIATGTPLRLPQEPRPLGVVLPDGRRVPVVKGQETFLGTDKPGIYQLETTEGEVPFAVNIPPEESRTLSMNPDRLEQLGVVFPGSTAKAPTEEAGNAHQPYVEIEKRQKIWKWLLLSAFFVFLLETYVAGRMTRHTQATEVA